MKTIFFGKQSWYVKSRILGAHVHVMHDRSLYKKGKHFTRAFIDVIAKLYLISQKLVTITDELFWPKVILSVWRFCVVTQAASKQQY